MNRFKIYVNHLGRRLAREMWEVIRHLLFPKAWVYLSPVIAIYLFYIGVRLWWLFAVFTLVSFIMYDYDQGEWIGEYRREEKKRLLKKAKHERILREVEDEKNGSS